MIRPASSTAMRWATLMVLSRWAMMTVVRPCISRLSASWTRTSDSLSRELVASSSSRMRGSLRIARAMAIRCRCPPLSFVPRSPTTVSYCSGKPMMKSWALAALAAAIISLLARIQTAVENVLPNGAAEQHRLLRHYGHLRPETLLRDRTQIPAVHAGSPPAVGS